MRIDPNKTWGLVEERYESEEDPILKRNLGIVLRHMKAEAVADIDGIIETLVDSPKYIMHGTDNDPMLNPTGSHDAVRAFYDLTIVQPGSYRFEFDVHRVFVDEGGVMTEGTMRMAYPGASLQAYGVEVDDPEAYYVTNYPAIYIWPVDSESGKLLGEEIYNFGDMWAGIADRKISLDDIEPLQAA